MTPRRCCYCGAIAAKGSPACAAHADLPAIDPHLGDPVRVATTTKGVLVPTIKRKTPRPSGLLREPLGATIKPADELEVPVLGAVEVTPAGNVALRIGRTRVDEPGWRQVEYVVLTPNEAAELELVLGRARGADS